MGTLRFGGARDDPLRVSSSYTLRSGRAGDVYLIHRRLGNRIKVSLHANGGVWKIEQDGRGPNPGPPTRQTWQPADAVKDGHEPAIRVLIPRGGVTQPVDALPESIEWTVFAAETQAVEFKVYIVPAPRVKVEMGPGISAIGHLPLPNLDSLCLVVAEWHDSAPVSPFFVSLPKTPEVDQAMGKLAARTHGSGMWSTAGGVCFILDRVTLKPTDV